MRETQRETGTIETPLRVTLNRIPKDSQMPECVRTYKDWPAVMDMWQPTQF